MKTADSTILGCNQENCFPFFSFEQEFHTRGLNRKDGDWLFGFCIFLCYCLGTSTNATFFKVNFASKVPGEVEVMYVHSGFLQGHHRI